MLRFIKKGEQSRAVHGAMCYDLTKLHQLEVLYWEALRAITGLPRHTRVEELYRYAGLPTLGDTISACITGANDRRHLTLQGRRLLRHDCERVLDRPPIHSHVRPWEDVLITERRPAPQKTARATYAAQRATLVQTTAATDAADPRTVRVYVDASWQPRTAAVARAAVAAESNERSVTAYIVDYIPDSTNLELRAIQQGLRLARSILQACTQRAYHCVHIFTNCDEALRSLVGIPRKQSAAHYIKRSCSSLQRVFKGQ